VFGGAVWMRLRSYAADASATERPGSRGDAATRTRTASGTMETVSEGQADPSQGAGSLAVPRPGETVAQASERERRYNELLRNPPPAPAISAEPPPSFLDRVVAPIATALGMSPHPKPPTQAGPTPAQMQQQADRASGDQSSTKNDKDPGDTTKRDEDDPDTDTAPPQLMGAEFTPSQVQDGEQTTLAVLVNDNLSGVRSVSGVINSPSGSMQGFACTREGDTNRYVARITVPEDAAEGVWVVKYLTLSDNASNSVNLNQTAGALPPSASFRVVSSSSDSTGPKLTGITIDRPAMRAGEKNTVFIQAEDDKSGVALVSGVFVSPSKTARIGFGCRGTDAGTWECAVAPPACLDCGDWHLEQIQLQDKANNLTTVRGDNPAVRALVLNIVGDHCDSAAPVVTQLTLDPSVVSNAQASIISVRAVLMDEGGCGVASLSGQAVPPGGVGGQRRYFSFDPSPDGLTFTGKLEIPQFAAKGIWTIAWIQALDKGHNLRAYSSSDPVVARATFRVE